MTSSFFFGFFVLVFWSNRLDPFKRIQSLRSSIFQCIFTYMHDSFAHKLLLVSKYLSLLPDKVMTIVTK
jgi:hypothetical protein